MEDLHWLHISDWEAIFIIQVYGLASPLLNWTSDVFVPFGALFLELSDNMARFVVHTVQEVWAPVLTSEYFIRLLNTDQQGSVHPHSLWTQLSNQTNYL